MGRQLGKSVKQIKNKAHLWKPGQSGNPKGRPPKDLSITTRVKEILPLPAEDRYLDPEDYGKGLTNRDAIALRIVRGCQQGESWALDELWARVDGKVKDTVELQGTITVHVDKEKWAKRQVDAQSAIPEAGQAEKVPSSEKDEG